MFYFTNKVNLLKKTDVLHYYTDEKVGTDKVLTPGVTNTKSTETSAPLRDILFR